MKKKNLIILTIFFTFFLSTQISYSYSYEDYKLYLQAKKELEAQNYEKAKKDFLRIKKSFPYSNINKKKFVDFFLGVTEYHLKNYEEAIPLLTQSVLPQYEEDRNFLLSDMYIKKRETKNALLYLQRLLSSKYTYSHEIIEKQIRNTLTSLDSYYQYYFEVKFDKNFSHFSLLKTEDLFEILEYFSSKGEEKEKQQLILSYLEKNVSQEKNLFPFYQKLLESFFLTENYNSILHYSDIFIKADKEKKEHYDFYLLQKARAYLYKEDYIKSIFEYEQIQNPRYTQAASLELASIQYFLENYKKVLELLEKKPLKTEQDWKLLARSYFALKEKKKLAIAVKKLEEENPNDYENIFYQFLMKHNEIPFKQANSLLFTTLIVDSYLDTLYDFDFQNWKHSNSLEYQKMMDLEDINDPDILTMEIENSQFYTISILENGVFMSRFYEKYQCYDFAFQNSFKHVSEFAKFKNLIYFLFPRYYKNSIQKYSFEYEIPEEILNTLILMSSQWDTNYEKQDKIGLFALEASMYKNPLELKNPEISIELACQKLKHLEKKYPQVLPRMIAFLYGEDYLKELNFEENGDISLSNITNIQKKEDLQHLMLNYSFYKKLYHF